MSETLYFHSFIPHKHRLMTLVGFIRTHISDTIIVGCNGTSTTKFLSIFFNNLDIRAGSISGKMPTKAAPEEPPELMPELIRKELQRFNEGELKLIFVSQQLLPSYDFIKPKYFLQYDIPSKTIDEIKIINHLKPDKFVLFLDKSQEKYVTDFERDAKIESKELPFNEKKIPNIYDELEKLLKKSFPLYESSEKAYRELIRTYVNHENKDIFCARQLPLLDVAHSFGIKAPPKLPLE
ncbi:DEAD-box ATP-dependent RNA helicase 27 [Histomonas meleagridis]|uniref:DEAD-box ATP-dependent RNA helicase 27 n=1 Tax=Histomonas meleagridis TaxID=135588 RepID=UPI0035599A73|nr:DEAD-box ATP-dependent RNA helicase 27 [Histomonas meleagridis]KAH0802989.1 DEAD-box ATP-dependent RNA helicase 27 [Histomonas meleagridis]